MLHKQKLHRKDHNPISYWLACAVTEYLSPMTLPLKLNHITKNICPQKISLSLMATIRKITTVQKVMLCYTWYYILQELNQRSYTVCEATITTRREITCSKLQFTSKYMQLTGYRKTSMVVSKWSKQETNWRLEGILYCKVLVFSGKNLSPFQNYQIFQEEIYPWNAIYL